MKRVISLILALLMCIVLISCGKTDVNAENDAPVSDETAEDEALTEQETDTEEEPVVDPKTIWNGTLEHPDEVGFFDPDYDYTANPRYKVCTYADGRYTNIEKYDAAIAHWCEKMNIQYDGLIMSKNIDEQKELEQIAQEYDGVILITSQNYNNAMYAEILNNSDCAWMSYWEMRDNDTEGAPILRPALSYGDRGVTQLVSYMKTYIDENLADVDPSEIGIVYTSYTNLVIAEEMEQVFLDEIKTQLPEFWGDMSSVNPADWGSLARVELNTGTIDYSYEYLFNKAIYENPQFKYWLFVPLINPSPIYDVSYSIEENGLAETSAVFNRTDAYEVWQVNGYEVYEAVCTLPLVLDVEPIVGALYAFMNGDAEPETIWGGDENGFGTCEIDSFCLVTKENHVDFLRKINEYAGGTVYDLGEETASEGEEYTDEFYEPTAPDYRYDYYANKNFPNGAPFRYEDVADKTVIATVERTESAAKQYESVTEMSKVSPVIVAGEIIDIRYVDSNPGAGGLNWAYTIYDIKISDIAHGDYSVGDIISVFEYGGYIRSGEYNMGFQTYDLGGTQPLKMEENEVIFAQHHAGAPTSKVGDKCVMFLHALNGQDYAHKWKNTGAWTGKFIVGEDGNVTRWSKDKQEFEVWGTYDELMDIARNTAFDEALYDSNSREEWKP